MKSRLVFLALLALVACRREGDGPVATVSSEPVSVRGWIADVERTIDPNEVRTPETEIARLTSLFSSVNLWVENAQFVSGGMAQNGSFVLLDVPPGQVTVGLDAPGAAGARVLLQNIPGNADVLIPGIILKPGGATILDPKAIRVRIAGKVDKPTPTGRTAIVAGHTVPVYETPVDQMADRRDWPTPEGAPAPIATVR